MKYIPLTQGKTAIIDDDNYEQLSRYKWYYSQGYAVRKENGSSVSMHRQILSVVGNDEIDHIDGNGINNVRANMRVVSHMHNLWNRKPNTNSRSGYKGVEKRGNKWRAVITVTYRVMRLGTFATPEAAALAYDIAARTHFGDYARLNFPDKND